MSLKLQQPLIVQYCYVKKKNFGSAYPRPCVHTTLIPPLCPKGVDFVNFFFDRLFSNAPYNMQGHLVQDQGCVSSLPVVPYTSLWPSFFAQTFLKVLHSTVHLLQLLALFFSIISLTLSTYYKPLNGRKLQLSTIHSYR